MNEDIITTDEIIDDCEENLSTEDPCHVMTEKLPTEEKAEEEALVEEVLDAVALKNELEELKVKLAEKESALERMSREIGEFSEIFPEKQINSIPDSVWASVKEGIPLAAAYALYERKNAVRAGTAELINTRNNERSTGSIGRANTENFYTPSEVKAMSREEVRKNYTKIIESMKKWN